MPMIVKNNVALTITPAPINESRVMIDNATVLNCHNASGTFVERRPRLDLLCHRGMPRGSARDRFNVKRPNTC
jgi:hypothetical protein